MKSLKKAVILLSGGLDSATVLAMAKNQGFDCYAISFDYSQKHIAELKAAKKIANYFNVVEHKIFTIDLSQFGGSALTDNNLEVPISGITIINEIPITYVPARNTIMLSIALGWAEVLGCNDIFYGANSVDYSGYPDCRPKYVKSFETMANLATKSGIEGNKIIIHTPIIDLTKAQIIAKGLELDVDYSLTTSCYKADEFGRACGVCDSCRIRKQGFIDAKVLDVTEYI